jgi:hypothetical protein
MNNKVGCRFHPNNYYYFLSLLYEEGFIIIIFSLFYMKKVFRVG